MKPSAYNSKRGEMKFSRLVMYLFLVAVFEFLNVFMVQNYGQARKDGEMDSLNNNIRNELVKLDLTVPVNPPEIKL